MNTIQKVVPKKERNVTDEEFLGIWDQSQGVWTVEPSIDYLYNDELKIVEESVKNKDYNQAKEQLLTYFRNTKRKYHDNSNRRNLSALTNELLMNDVYSVVEPIKDFYIPTKKSYFGIDITDVFSKAKESAKMHLSFMFMARYKNELAELSSRTGENAPYILVVGKNKEYKLVAVADTYIRAGKYIDECFGDEDKLFINESGSPMDDNMMRTYIQFDMDEAIFSDEIVEAKIMLYGNTQSDKEMRALLFNSEDALVNEENKCLKNAHIKTLSFDKKPDEITGFQYKVAKREGVDLQYYNIITRFWQYGSLLSEYSRSHDEKCAMHYIKECKNYYDSLGGGEQLIDPEERSRGNESLNTGFRLQQTINGYYDILQSASITPDTNLTFLKMFYDEREFISNDCIFWTHFSKDCNWGMTQTISHFYVCHYFPELAGRDKHLEEVDKRMNYMLHSLILEDGAYVEATNGYPIEVFRDLQFYKYFREMDGGKLPEGADEALIKFARFFMNCTEPGFYMTEYGDMHYTKNADHLTKYINNIAKMYGDKNLEYVATKGQSGEKPQTDSVVYPYGKFAIFRNGWDKDSLFMFTNFRPVAVHKHNDALNMTLYAYGNRVLTDNSDISYNKEPVAIWQRSSRFSHNVCSIDDRTGYAGWTAEGYTRVDGDANVEITTECDLMDGWFTEKIDEDIIQKHNRKIMYIKTLGIFVVSDFLETNKEDGKHVYRQNWQFEPLANVTAKAGSIYTDFEEGGNVVVSTVSHGSDAELNFKTSYHDSITSTYGEYVVEKEESHAQLTTVIVPFLNENVEVSLEPISVDDEKAAAAKIQVKVDGVTKEGVFFSYFGTDKNKQHSFDKYKTQARTAFFEKDDKCTYTFM